MAQLLCTRLRKKGRRRGKVKKLYYLFLTKRSDPMIKDLSALTKGNVGGMKKKQAVLNM
jgi:hypothetical protein